MLKLSNIQLLRFLAALMVLFSHLADQEIMWKSSSQSHSWVHLLSYGKYGVDIFFVISGYVITSSYMKTKKTPWEFIVVRFFRIYPIYAIATTLLTLLHLLVPSLMAESSITLRNVLSSLTFTSNVFGYEYPFLPQGWTLEIEVLFYCIFVGSIIFCSLSQRFQMNSNILSILIISFCALIGAPTIMLEFIYGILIASILSTKGRNFLICISIFMISISILIFSRIDLDDFRVFSIGAPSAILVYFATRLPQITLRGVGFLGEISYSMYLLHGMSIAFLNRLFAFLEIQSIPLFILCVLIVVLLISSISYLKIERPFNDIGKKYVKHV
jgi:peptidoglycan/LPS O-acetylase OafA/YrhL